MNKVDEPKPIRWFDLSDQCQRLRGDVMAAIGRVIDARSFILGEEVRHFEAEFADKIGVKHCVGVNSGTSALHLALLACGVGCGDEVITTPMSFIATSWAISYVGARPVFVDIDRTTCCIDVAAVEEAITSRTKAIIPVHLYGFPCNVAALSATAQRHGVVLIEDGAQAHGAKLGAQCVGTFGKAGCFSFYPSKNLGAFGEAGAIVTNDAGLAEAVRKLRDHSQSSRNVHESIGYNMRMDGIQAAVLRVKLPWFEEWNRRRRQLAGRYSKQLGAISAVEVPAEPSFGEHVWHIYAVQSDRRDQLASYLADNSIGTSIHYPTPIHLQPAYAELGYRHGDFPEAERLAGTELSLPMYPELSDADHQRVIDTVQRWAE